VISLSLGIFGAVVESYLNGMSGSWDGFLRKAMIEMTLQSDDGLVDGIDLVFGSGTGWVLVK
jgi:hypothetical protein